MKHLFYLIFILIIPISFYAQDNNTEIPKTNPNQHFNPADFPEGVNNIILIVNLGCGRCESVQTILKNAEIEFTVQEIGNGEDYSELDSKIHEILPYKNLGYSIKYPVIQLDDRLYYSIDNHNTFVTSLIEFITIE